MSLRQIRRDLRGGALVLQEGGEPSAKTPFQKQRLTHAATLARIYLTGDQTVEEIGRGLGVTGEAIAQMVRVGISCLKREGWLRPREDPGPDAPACHSTRS